MYDNILLYKTFGDGKNLSVLKKNQFLHAQGVLSGFFFSTAMFFNLLTKVHMFIVFVGLVHVVLLVWGGGCAVLEDVFGSFYNIISRPENFKE